MQEHNQAARDRLLEAARQAIRQDNVAFLKCILQLPCEDVRQHYQQSLISEQSQILFLLIDAIKQFYASRHAEPITKAEWEGFLSSLRKKLKQDPAYECFSQDNMVLALDRHLNAFSALDTAEGRGAYLEDVLELRSGKLKQMEVDERLVITSRRGSVSELYREYERGSYLTDHKKERDKKERNIDILLAGNQARMVLDQLGCQTSEEAKALLMDSDIPAFIPYCYENESKDPDTAKSLFEYAQSIRARTTLRYLIPRHAALGRRYPTIAHDLEHASALHHVSLPSSASHAPIYRRLVIFYSAKESPDMTQPLFYSALAYIASGEQRDKAEHDRLYAHSTDDFKKKFFAQLLRTNLQTDRWLTLLEGNREDILRKIPGPYSAKPLLAYLLGADLSEVLFKMDRAFDQPMLFHLLKTQKIPTDFKIKAINFYLRLHSLDGLRPTSAIADELRFFLRRALCDSLSQAEISDFQNDEQRLQLRTLAALQNCTEEAAMQQIWEYKMLIEALKAHTNLLSQDICNALEIALMRQDGMESFKAIEDLLDQQLGTPLLQSAEKEREEKKEEEKEEESATAITRPLSCWRMSRETVVNPEAPGHQYVVSHSPDPNDSGFEVLGVTRESCVAELLEVLHTKHLFQQSDASKDLCDLLGRDLESAAHFVRFSLGDKEPLPLGIAHWYAKQHLRSAAFAFWKAIPESPGEIRDEKICHEKICIPPPLRADPNAADVTHILVPGKEQRYARLTEVKPGVDPNLHNVEGKKQLRRVAGYVSCLRNLYVNVSQKSPSEKALAEQRVHYFLRQIQENPDADKEHTILLELLMHPHFFESRTPGVNGWEHAKMADILQVTSFTQAAYKARAIKPGHLHQQISRDIDALSFGNKPLKEYVQTSSELKQDKAEYQNLNTAPWWAFRGPRKFLKIGSIAQKMLAIEQLKEDGLEGTLPPEVEGLEQFDSLLNINHRLRQLTSHAHEARIRSESMQADVCAVKDAPWLPENARATLHMLHWNQNERVEADSSSVLPPALSEFMVHNFRLKFYANIEQMVLQIVLDQDQPVQADDVKAEPDQQAAYDMWLLPTAARRPVIDNLADFLISHYEQQLALIDEDSQGKFAVFLAKMAIFYVRKYRREAPKTIEGFVHWLDTGPELKIRKGAVVQTYEGGDIYLRATGRATCLDLVSRSGYRCTTAPLAADEDEIGEEIRYAWQKEGFEPLPEYGFKTATPTQVAEFEEELRQVRESYPWYPEDHMPAWYAEQDKTRWLTKETVAAYKDKPHRYKAIEKKAIPNEAMDVSHSRPVSQGQLVAVSNSNQQVTLVQRELQAEKAKRRSEKQAFKRKLQAEKAKRENDRQMFRRKLQAERAEKETLGQNLQVMEVEKETLEHSLQTLEDNLQMMKAEREGLEQNQLTLWKELQEEKAEREMLGKELQTMKMQRENEKRTQQVEKETQNQTITTLAGEVAWLRDMMTQLMQEKEQMKKEQEKEKGQAAAAAHIAPIPATPSSPMIFHPPRVSAAGEPAVVGSADIAISSASS